MEHEEDRNPRRSDANRMVTRIAYAPSKRQKELTSRKKLNVPLKPSELYMGEDLKKGYR